MKNNILVASLIGFVSVSAFNSASAQAARSKNPSASVERPVVSAQASSDRSGGSRFGLGFTTISGGTAASPVIAAAASPLPAFSAYLEMSDSNALQLHFGIGGTNGGFSFGAGAIYKYTFKGGRDNGMHLGGGFDLGTQGGTFFMAISPTIGFHFTPSSTPVMFSIDGGPAVTIVNSSADFMIAGFSRFLGLSVHYFL